MKVRIGYGLGTQGRSGDGAGFLEFVDALEELRFDSLWLSERLTGTAPDPLIGLAMAAARTTRLKLGTSVQVLPGRNPVDVAKQWASLDRLSGGRALPAFGLGVADPSEQQAFGVDRKARAGWFDEALPLIRRLWTEDVVDHDGPRFHYEGLRLRYKPLQSPPDVWLGGAAPAELRRVGRLGDGWLPSFCTPDDAAAGKLVVQAAADEAGRQLDPEHWGALVIYLPPGEEIPDRIVQVVAARRPGTDPREIVPVGTDALKRQVERFVEVGFSKLVLVPAGQPDDWRAELDALAGAVLPLQAALST